MKIVAGLGNPGREYEHTPHSIGFAVVEALAREIGAEFRSTPSYTGDLAEGRIANGKLLLVKPMTFMNLSGNCIAPVVKYHNATAADLLVISDDIDMPVGKLRIRKGGSAGGHNGLKNIIERLGTPDFVRLKVGVGRDKKDRREVISHVLGKFDPATAELMEREIIPAAVKAARQILTEGADSAMNTWNGWNACTLTENVI